MKLELLSPAKNLEFGREAINHGADALYIGAPAFGARQAATNSIEDIEELAKYAHLFGSKVFATTNTLLFDDEIDDAVKMIRQLYNIGVDAILIQDMGLLECNLPPIELHASTQCHNASAERIKFLETAGFSRVVLARETSLEQMREIHEATHVDLEAFIHGALCVSYSGQCYMSQYLTTAKVEREANSLVSPRRSSVGAANRRSGNRGGCSQPCRSTYDLYNGDGKLLIKEKHLLSLKDFNASQQLRNMIDAGITSFKIEGRLKDLSYVKNVTAYYRQLLDSMMDENGKSSSGSCTFFFTPDVEKTFNRGYTDYFLRDRQPMASFATQKSIGKRIGKVTSIGGFTLSISGTEPFTNGDGLCYIDADGRMQGFLVNNVQGRTVTPNRMPDLTVGTVIWRNNDQLFEKQLQGRTAERKIAVTMCFDVTPEGFCLKMTDENGITIVQPITVEHQEANNPTQTAQNIFKQLSKLGDSPFYLNKLTDETDGRYFIPASILNQLRREAVERLKEQRICNFHPKDHLYTDRGHPYPAEQLDYRANVINKKAEEFYRKHGVKEIEHGLEETEDYDNKALMTTKYCLRYELGCCLQGKNSGKALVDIKPTDTLILRNNDRHFRLEFDCRQCLMCIYKK